MGTESIEASFLSIFALITFFIFLIISKYSFKIKSGVLLDTDFSKPQAFHETPISRSGGVGAILSLCLFFYIYYLLYSEILYNYILISLTSFLIGFSDDLRLHIKPNKRLILMIVSLFILIYFLPINLFHVDIPILSYLLENKLFSSIFVLICFLFIINGANLIDGFNGLLTFNLIIINFILTYLNIREGNVEFSLILIAQIIILLVFLLFNFPKAKIFLGDSGAYLFGSLAALNTVTTNNLIASISSLFFCSLLFYPFFEVFFSFFRKIYQRKSPLYPDKEHLHMLSHVLITSKYGKSRADYLNSLFINLFYLILVLPGLIFIDNAIFSRYWFFILLLIYLFVYSRLYRLTKN